MTLKKSVNTHESLHLSVKFELSYTVDHCTNQPEKLGLLTTIKMCYIEETGSKIDCFVGFLHDHECIYACVLLSFV